MVQTYQTKIAFNHKLICLGILVQRPFEDILPWVQSFLSKVTKKVPPRNQHEHYPYASQLDVTGTRDLSHGR